MSRLLHNVQQRSSVNFAYCALEAFCIPCNRDGMRIRLKEFRDRLGLTLEDMEAKAGFSKSQLSRWEQMASNIPSERLPDLAKAYECRIADIFDEGDSPFVPLGPRLYVKGTAAAGRWLPVWEQPEDEWQTFTGRADVTAPLTDRFGVRVVGESMNELYPDGTIVECVSFLGRVEIRNGRRVVVRRQRNGDEYEVTIKEYHRDDDGVEWLVPKSYNPAFQTPIRMDVQEPGIEEVRIIGIVVGSYRPE